VNRFRFNSLLLPIALLVVIVGAGWAYTKYSGTLQRLEAAENARATLEMDLKVVASQAESVKEAADRSLAEVRSQLTEVLSAKDTAELSLKQAREQLARVESDKDTAEGKLQVANTRLGHLQAARQEAERAATKANEDLAREHAAREKAEQAGLAPPAGAPVRSQ
jgi:chromosome segregation ATPase